MHQSWRDCLERGNSVAPCRHWVWFPSIPHEKNTRKVAKLIQNPKVWQWLRINCVCLQSNEYCIWSRQSPIQHSLVFKALTASVSCKKRKNHDSMWEPLQTKMLFWNISVHSWMFQMIEMIKMITWIDLPKLLVWKMQKFIPQINFLSSLALVSCLLS